MNIAKKRLVSGVLAAILLCFCGCSQKESVTDEGISGPEDTQVAENNASVSEKKEQNLFDLLEKEDFGGREFVIATTDEAFTDSENESGIIGGAIYRRNRAIEEKFNIKNYQKRKFYMILIQFLKI